MLLKENVAEVVQGIMLFVWKKKYHALNVAGVNKSCAHLIPCKEFSSKFSVLLILCLSEKKGCIFFEEILLSLILIGLIRLEIFSLLFYVKFAEVIIFLNFLNKSGIIALNYTFSRYLLLFLLLLFLLFLSEKGFF